VYLIRDPFKGVRSEPLHEDCAALWYKRRPEEGVSVPFMITKGMKGELRARALDNTLISYLTPQEAHDIISGAVSSYRTDAYVLHAMRQSAYARRYAQDRGWETGENEDVKIDSGDCVEKEWPDEMKAQYRKMWPKLSAEDQKVLAKWRAKHFGD